MRISIREHKKIPGASDITGIRMPDVWGDDEEAYVRDYLDNPTQSKRDYIVALSERISRTYYRKFNIPGGWKEYRQETVIKILELLDSYKPEKGNFIGWIMLCLDGFSKTYRGKAHRHFKTQVPKGLIPFESENDAYHKAESVFVDTEYSTLRSLDIGTTHSILDELVVRFCTEPEISICRFSVEYLKEQKDFPSFRLVYNTFFGRNNLTTEELYFFHQYIKVACHLHFVKWLKEDAHVR